MVINFEIESQARVLVRFETKQELQEKLAKVQRQLDTKPPLWIKDLYQTDKEILERAIQILDK